ncbi:MAG TPA: MCE family protein [Marmoricola sp.]|nr:MCE family protein [Marmoricola sp.]
MSEIMFPRTRPHDRPRLRLKLAMGGVVFALVFGLISLGVGLHFIGFIGGDLSATAKLSETGDQLGAGSDVKFRGLRVGRVIGINHDVDESGHQSAQIEIFSEFNDQIPATVRSRVVPGTVFGNEFITLDLPPTQAQSVALKTDPGDTTDFATGQTVTGPWLRAGAKIPADTTREATRVMESFASVQQLLAEVNPAVLDQAVSSLAAALEGNGDELNAFLKRSDTMLTTWSSHESQVLDELRLLANGTDTIAAIRPQVITALKQSVPTAKRISAEQTKIDQLLRDGARGAKQFDSLLTRNGVYFTMVFAGMAATLATFVQGTAAFESIIGQAPGVLRNGAQAVKSGKIQMDALFSFDTIAPYAAQDCPRYGSLPGKNCR